MVVCDKVEAKAEIEAIEMAFYHEGVGVWGFKLEVLPQGYRNELARGIAI